MNTTGKNQIAEVDYKLIDGDNTANTDLFVLRKRAWEHDYFTACAPSPQAGEAVDLPIDNSKTSTSNSKTTLSQTQCSPVHH